MIFCNLANLTINSMGLNLSRITVVYLNISNYFVSFHQNCASLRWSIFIAWIIYIDPLYWCMINNNLNAILNWLFFQHQTQLHLPNQQNSFIHFTTRSYMINQIEGMMQLFLLEFQRDPLPCQKTSIEGKI